MSRSLLDQEKLATLDTISKGKQADDALLTAERKAAGLAIELEESRQREKALAARRLASDKALQAMRRTIGQGLAALLNVGDSTSPVCTWAWACAWGMCMGMGMGMGMCTTWEIRPARCGARPGLALAAIPRRCQPSRPHPHRPRPPLATLASSAAPSRGLGRSSMSSAELD